MKNSKTLSLALMLLLTVTTLGSAPSSCGKNPGLNLDPAVKGPETPDLFKDAPPLPQKIINLDLGVVLAFPDDWTVSENPENPVLFAMAPGADLNGPLANLVVEKLTHRMNSFDYMEANTLTMKTAISGLEVKWGGVENLAGTSSAWLQFTFNRGGVKMEALSYCQTRDYHAYVVTALAPATQFETNEALFRAIGRSLKVHR